MRETAQSVGITSIQRTSHLSFWLESEKRPNLSPTTPISWPTSRSKYASRPYHFRLT